MSKMLKIDQIHYKGCNAMYVEDVKDGKRIYTHIFAHNFLNIQPIFNPEKVLGSWDLELFNHTILCMSKHVKDVEGWNPFNIKEVMSKNMFVCIWSLWSIIIVFYILDTFDIHSLWSIIHSISYLQHLWHT